MISSRGGRRLKPLARVALVGARGEGKTTVANLLLHFIDPVQGRVTVAVSSDGAIAYTAGALAQQQRGDHPEAARQLERVRRLRPLLRGAPWLNADLALRCADMSLDLGELAGALEFAQVAGDALQGYPDGGTLPARLQRLERRIRRGQDYGLTAAELRLVAFLPTHLSLQEIADRLHLSRFTVKTQVASIYDKLGVPGRSEAVEIIEQRGLGSTAAKVTIRDPDLD